MNCPRSLSRIAMLAIVMFFSAALAGMVSADVIQTITNPNAVAWNDHAAWDYTNPDGSAYGLHNPFQVYTSDYPLEITGSAPGASLESRKQGSSWFGNFNTGDGVLYETSNTTLNMQFSKPVSSLGFYIQPGLITSSDVQFTGAIVAYSPTGINLGTYTVAGTSTRNPGTATFIGIQDLSGFDIGSVQIYSDYNSYGTGIDTLNLVSPTPEPQPVAVVAGVLVSVSVLRRLRARPLRIA